MGMTQIYSGTTTIVPQVCLRDYLLLFAQQSVDDMRRYFQGGSVAAYQHVAMLKLHYKIAHALDECLASLELEDSSSNASSGGKRARDGHEAKTLPQFGKLGLHFTKLESRRSGVTSIASTVSDGLSDDVHDKRE